jgi:hypothetical protein
MKHLNENYALEIINIPTKSECKIEGDCKSRVIQNLWRTYLNDLKTNEMWQKKSINKKHPNRPEYSSIWVFLLRNTSLLI